MYRGLLFLRHRLTRKFQKRISPGDSVSLYFLTNFAIYLPGLFPSGGSAVAHGDKPYGSPEVLFERKKSKGLHVKPEAFRHVLRRRRLHYSADSSVSSGEFVAQFASRFFTSLLFRARDFEGQRRMLAAFVESLQHEICFRPARAAAGGGFDHLQAGLSFGPSRRAFLLDRLQSRAIAIQFLNQHYRVGCVQISRAIQTSFYTEQITSRARDQTRGVQA